MSDNLIIYHANCIDGFTAAWVIVRTLESMKQTYDLLPASYGDAPPTSDLLVGKSVYIVDFSYHRSELNHIWNHADKLRVLDHHASAQKDCKDLSFCTFDMERSGAGLALAHWLEAPEAVGPGGIDLVDFVEDYDLWKWEFEETQTIHHYIETIAHTLTNWDNLAHDMEHNYTKILNGGQAIQSYVDKLVGEIADKAYKAKLPRWGGYKDDVIMANCPPKLVSLVGERLLAVYTEEPMAAMWYRDNKRVYNFSLRSRITDEYNVAEVARMFKGGGHLRAAGFRSGELE